MKRIITYCAGVLLSAALLIGCAEDVKQPDSVTVLNEDETYLNRIAELEEALQKEREDRYISDAAYTATIKKLQSELNAILPSDTTAKDEAADEELVFRYKLENGKAIVTGYEGRSTLVTVPATLNGYAVAAIGERAFEGKKLAAVILPEGLEAVGWFAFYGCEELMDVTIPDSVTSIGYAVFDGCPNITLICRNGTYAAQYADSYGLPRVSPK